MYFSIRCPVPVLQKMLQAVLCNYLSAGLNADILRNLLCCQDAAADSKTDREAGIVVVWIRIHGAGVNVPNIQTGDIWSLFAKRSSGRIHISSLENSSGSVSSKICASTL